MKRMLYVTGLLLCTSLGGYAQEGNLIDVKVVNEEVKKQGSEVSLRMTLDLTGLRVGNQKSVCLHPAVVSADGTHEAVLAPVVVDGKTRSRVHRREKALTGASPATDNAYTVLRSGRESRVEYIAKLAYEPWMVDSRLVLRERMTGCLDCTAATEESTVKAPFIKLFTPRYVTPFVTPEREAVKVPCAHHPFLLAVQVFQNPFSQRNGRTTRGIQLVHVVGFYHRHIVVRELVHNLCQVLVHRRKDSHTQAEVRRPEQRLTFLLTQTAHLFAMLSHPSGAARYHFYPILERLQTIAVSH